MKTDLEIQKDVVEQLKWEPFLNAAQIGVSVKNGIVTLSGQVDAYSKKILAEKAAKKVAGVKAIAEELQPLRYQCWVDYIEGRPDGAMMLVAIPDHLNVQAAGMKKVVLN